MIGEPLHALVLVLDVRAFSGLTNPEQLATRRLLYQLLIAAFEAGGVPWEECAHEDRGDGVLVVVPSTVPKTVVMGPVLTELVRKIADAPADGTGREMQVRIAAHGGEVHHDGRGFVGSDVILAFRLLDSEVLRDALSRASARSVVLVSDPLYQSTVRHGYPGMEDRQFQPVEASTKETSVRGWLHVPGGKVALTPAKPLEEKPPASRSAGGVHINAGADINVHGGVIAGGDVITALPRRRPWWRRGEEST